MQSKENCSLNNTIKIMLAGIIIEFQADKELIFQQYSASFKTETSQPNIIISISFVKQLPAVSGRLVGEDLLFEYYQEGNTFYRYAKRGIKGSISCAEYRNDFSEISLYINEGDFPGIVRTVDKACQLLPMNQLLCSFDVMMLHSSRVFVQGKAIVFTAPSQVGKTTQARLWSKYQGAKIIGNDRTLIRKEEQDYHTYGYFVDGDCPAGQDYPAKLGAIVVLGQDEEDSVQKLSPLTSLKYLMSQTVVDAWNSEQMCSVREFWFGLIEKYPVYYLKCRPDENAVICLKQQLEKDGVLYTNDSERETS